MKEESPIVYPEPVTEERQVMIPVPSGYKRHQEDRVLMPSPGGRSTQTPPQHNTSDDFDSVEAERTVMIPKPGNWKHSPEPSPLKELLSAKEKPAVKKQPVHGVVIGELLRLYSDSAFVNVPEYGLNYVAAKFICAHDLLKDRKQVAIMFEGGDTSKPLIIGAMEEPKPKPIFRFLERFQRSAKLVAIDNQKRVVIEAEQEIELRCGEASILLTNDGRILLRGNYVSSQATATQRIRGGSVQIN